MIAQPDNPKLHWTTGPLDRGRGAFPLIQTVGGAAATSERPYVRLPEGVSVVVVGEADITEVQRHEQATVANARLGGYGMDAHCPMNEIRCYRVMLESSDLDRLFVLQDFATHTPNRTCRLRDVVPSTASLQRVASFATAGVDLRTHAGLELLLVGIGLDGGSLVAIDGNHRMIAHYLTQGSVDGVPAFIGVHPAMNRWPFVPPLARLQARQAESFSWTPSQITTTG